MAALVHPGSRSSLRARLRAWWPGLAFVAAATASAHAAFSWMGFNPTDDGFVLAFTRRLLQGEVPHRDFITYRPVGAALLHWPIVLLAGEHTYAASRAFVWLEWALFSWTWVWLLARHRATAPEPIARMGYAAIVLALSAHDFPVLAWYTVDGLLLATLGLALLDTTSRWRLSGFVLLGIACLCKQTFAPVLLVAALLDREVRRPAAWLAAAAPGLAYLALMLATGGLHDLFVQLRSQSSGSGLWAVGVRPYLRQPMTSIGFIVGWAAARLCAAGLDRGPLGRRPGLQQAAGLLLVHGAVVGCALLLARGEYQYTGNAAFFLFGAAAAFVAASFAEEWRLTREVRLGINLLCLAWSTSISAGHNTPALVAGPLAAVLMLWGRSSAEGRPAVRGPRWSAALLGLTVAAVVPAFAHARRAYVYRDRPAAELVHPLDGVFPGARGIRTSARTFAFLRDLRSAVALAKGARYAIVPDLAGYWVDVKDHNPLPVCWATKPELNDPTLLARAESALEAGRGRLVVIVQKVNAGLLSDGFFPVPDEPETLVPLVRRRFERFAETEYFELYR